MCVIYLLFMCCAATAGNLDITDHDSNHNKEQEVEVEASFQCIPAFDFMFPCESFSATPLINLRTVNFFWTRRWFQVTVATAVLACVVWSFNTGATLASRVCFMLFSVFVLLLLVSRVDRHSLWLLMSTSNRFEYWYLFGSSALLCALTAIETCLNYSQMRQYSIQNGTSAIVQVFFACDIICRTIR